jgi:hypothetical protein
MDTRSYPRRCIGHPNLIDRWVSSNASVQIDHTIREGTNNTPVQSDHFKHGRPFGVGPLALTPYIRRWRNETHTVAPPPCLGRRDVRLWNENIWNLKRNRTDRCIRWWVHFLTVTRTEIGARRVECLSLSLAHSPYLFLWQTSLTRWPLTWCPCRSSPRSPDSMLFRRG